MNEKLYFEIKNKYLNFSENFPKNIQKSLKINESQDFYLIEDSWIVKLKDIFEDYNKNNNENKNEIRKEFNYLSFFQKNCPKFINSFSAAVNYLKNEKHFKIISKELIDAAYSKKDLNLNNFITFFTGNNKLLIAFKDNNHYKSILLLNALDDINQKLFVIFISNIENKELIKEILNNNDAFFENLENNYKGQYIIPLKIYINTIELITNIYFYEKSLLEENSNIFKDDKKYYLINSEWINKVKNEEFYQQLIKFVNNSKHNNEDLKNDNIIYDNIIINKINFMDLEIEKMKPSTKLVNNNISYYTNIYIINSHILKIINNIFNDKEINNIVETIFVHKSKNKNNELYLEYSKKIIVGKLNEQLIIFPKYILYFNNSKDLKKEKQNVENSIEEYIKNYKIISKSEDK